MLDTLAYFPSADEDSYTTPLSGGRLVRKKILPVGGTGFTHPADPKQRIVITPEMAQTIKKNFDSKVVPYVQVPLVDDNNAHTESPLANCGIVKELEVTDDAIYATMEIHKHADDFGKTILDSSAFLHMNYCDTNTGNRVGATLVHVAATNRGHVRDMGEYQDALAASAQVENPEDIAFMSLGEKNAGGNADISSEQNILLMQEDAESGEPEAAEESVPAEEEQVSEEPIDEDGHMTPEEMIAALKGEGIDVEALQTRVTELEGAETQVAELSAQLNAVNEQLRLSGNEDISNDDLATAIVELSSSNKSLSTKVENLEAANATYVKREAEHEVDELVRTGRVLPAQRDALVKLSMSDRDTFSAIVPDKAIVSLSETGVTTHDETARAEELKSVVSDYAARAAQAR